MSQPERLNDPKLEQLESRLRGVPLSLPAEERDGLLFACGFAAGQAAAKKTAIRWLAGAAVLLMLVGGGFYTSRFFPSSRPRVACKRPSEGAGDSGKGAQVHSRSSRIRSSVSRRHAILL